MRGDHPALAYIPPMMGCLLHPSSLGTQPTLAWDWWDRDVTHTQLEPASLEPALPHGCLCSEAWGKGPCGLGKPASAGSGSGVCLDAGWRYQCRQDPGAGLGHSLVDREPGSKPEHVGTNLRPAFCSRSCCLTARCPLERGLGPGSHCAQVHYSWHLALGWLVVRLGAGCPLTCGQGRRHRCQEGRGGLANFLQEHVGYGLTLFHSLLCTGQLSMMCLKETLDCPCG